MEQRVKKMASAVVAATLFGGISGASAQEAADSRFYGAGMAGYVFHDGAFETIGYKDHALALHGVLGYRLMDNLALEFNVLGERTERDDNGKDYAYGAGLDMQYGRSQAGNLFYIVGLGGLYQDFFAEQNETSPYGNLGFGLYLPGFSEQQLVRTEVRWNRVVYRNDNIANMLGEDWVDEVRLNIGMQFDFPGAGPAYAQPAAVTDSDYDGVADAVDQCPGTPPNVVVTPAGCVPDLDNDGVADDRDRCPGTAAGTAVDPNGCELRQDADADGVADEQDRCANTPAGTSVDENGCDVNRDADGDGISDAMDQCPNTPASYQVDERGCVIVQKVVLTGVNFALGSDRLTEPAKVVLNSVADSLKLTPTLRVEVAGHTDSTGTPAFNLQLSKRRAAAVRNYLLSQGVPADRVTAEGYGLTQPVADNKTHEGRARNRRVEFRVISK